MKIMSIWIDRSISLQAAYTIADSLQDRPVSALFRAMDRLWADFRLINEDSQAQRTEATQKIAVELDRRNIPLRNPAIEEASLQAIRQQLGFSLDGNTDLHPDQRAQPILSFA
jgi:hypothetical protein